MTRPTRPDPVGQLADVLPGLLEGSAPTGGALVGNQHIVTVPLGPATFTQDNDYEAILLAAPTEGTYLKRVYLAAMTAPSDDSGDSLVNVFRYDVSETDDVNVTEAENYKPDDTGSMAAKKALKVPLTTDYHKRVASAGDVFYIEWKGATTYTAAPQDVAVTAIFVVPSVDAD